MVIYNNTNKEIDTSMLEAINERSAEYRKAQLEKTEKAERKAKARKEDIQFILGVLFVVAAIIFGIRPLCEFIYWLGGILF